MHHVAMLIIFSRRVLIRVTLVYLIINIGLLTVDNYSIILEANVFAFSPQLQHASLSGAPPGPEGSFPCSNYAPPKVGNYF
jgi:hypothetical protein